MKKIYVGNLSYKMSEEDLKEVFAKIGEVQSAKIITDAATGRSKGFGFVEMTSDEDADKAISSLNGTNLMDRTITVSEARPQREKGSFAGGAGGRDKRKGFDSSRGGRKPGNWR